MNIILNAKDDKNKWRITDDTIYYQDKEIKLSSITKVQYEPIEPRFKIGKIYIYRRNESSDKIGVFTLLYDENENALGEEVVEFILNKALKIKKSNIAKEKEKIKISRSSANIGCAIGIVILIVLGIIIYSIATFEPARTPTYNTQTQQSHECYVCGDNASLKYGSHYYCNTHWAMVKTMNEAD